MGNNLYDNVESLRRIVCPAIDAFNKYDEILDIVKTHAQKDSNSLILCLLGPTATVLAYDLFKEGYRALDLGHIDIEYEWYLHGTDWKSPVEGKAVNERGGNHPTNPIRSSDYDKQVIASVL